MTSSSDPINPRLPNARPIKTHAMAVSDVTIVAFGQVFQQILTLGTGIAVGRLLGASGYGLVNLLRSLTSTIATVAPLGLDLALLKIAGQSANDQDYLNATVQRLRLIACVINLAVALIIGFGFGGILMRDVYQYEGFDRMLVVTLLALPLGTDLAILSAYYKGINKPGTFALLSLYLQPVARVIMIGIAALTLVSPFTIICINTAQVAVSVIAVLINLEFHKRKAGIRPVQPPTWGAVRSIFAVSIWMALSLFIYGAMRFVDILFLGHFGTASDVGEYGALSTIAQLVQVYPLAASQTLGPIVSRCFHEGDMEGVKRALSRYIYTASIIAAFIFAGIAVFGDRLDLVFGHSFRFSAGVAFLMPLGYLLSATLAPTGYALSMTGRHRGETAILMLGAASLLILCWLLIPRWGQVGAATASATSFMIINLVRYVYVSRVLHFVPGTVRDFAPPLVALVCAYAGRLAIDAVAGRTLVATLAACVIFSALYWSACLLFLLHKEDRAPLLNRIRRRLGRLA